MSMVFRLQISVGGSTPIYRQIVEQIRREILCGNLSPETQLPSVRKLAEDLVINPNTVVRAFQELIRDGMVESHQGSGYFVAQRRQMFAKEERQRRLDEVLNAYVNEALTLDFSPEQILRAVQERLRGYSQQQDKGRSRR